MYFVYILHSEKNSRYYVGYTTNIAKRLKEHNYGKNISTKPYRPWKIVYSEARKTKKEAWLREKQIKNYKHGEAFKKLIGQC